MTQRLRIRLSDELASRLDAHASATLLDRDVVVEAALGAYLACVANLGQGWANLGQGWANLGQQHDQQPQPYVDPDCYAAPKTPHRGAKPTDSDEILALLETVNAMPDATETPDDLVMVNAKRKADILAQVGRLRQEIETKAP